MKKILIVAPLSELHFVESFPAFHALRRKYENSEIHVLLLETLVNVAKYLDCKLKWHPVSIEIYNLFQLHKFAVNNHDIFNIDVAYDFQGDFLSSYLLYAFRANKRYAVAKRSRDLGKIFCHKLGIEAHTPLELVSMVENVPMDSLIFFNPSMRDVKKEERLLVVYLDYTEYFISNADLLRTLFAEFDHFTIGLFFGQLGVGGAKELEECYQLKFRDFKIGFKLGQDQWDLPRSMLMSSVIVTNLPWLNALAAYYGLPSLYLGASTGLADVRGFTANVASLEMLSGIKLRLNNQELDIHHGVDLVYEFFKIEKEKALFSEGQVKSDPKIRLL